jgi:hypothetical protein
LNSDRFHTASLFPIIFPNLKILKSTPVSGAAGRERPAMGGNDSDGRVFPGDKAKIKDTGRLGEVMFVGRIPSMGPKEVRAVTFKQALSNSSWYSHILITTGDDVKFLY